MKKSVFYLLSFTWGLPLTLLGCVVALILVISGKRPKKWGYCWYFEVGKNWGGLELGLFFLKDPQEGVHIKNHEFGHGIQNCYFGLFMIPLICIPSAIRYWYRELKFYRRGKIPTTLYDDIWFEGMATRLGTEFYHKHQEYFK